MKQLEIFSLEEPKPTGLLHRCHLYKENQFKYTAFPTRKGMKLLGIRTSEALDMTLDEYREFIKTHDLREVGR